MKNYEENGECSGSYTSLIDTGADGSMVEDPPQRRIPKCSIKDVDSLARYFPMSSREKHEFHEIEKRYQLQITPHYFSLIKDINDSNDPIRMQCVPSVKEITFNSEEYIDPLGEEKTSVSSCLIHRYPNRALLIVTSKCFMYCRHCTRKRLWRNGLRETPACDIKKAIDYIRNNPEIREVIVSGGDPFTLSTVKLDNILGKLSSIDTVKVIRIGTRAPVVLPERVDSGLCYMLEKYDNIWINVQFNHPREITEMSVAACRKLQKCGIPISNQSVLLKGINDDPAVMKELCEKLTSIKVRPYYLFQCDPVVGASHFRTSVFKGVEIMEKMRGHTSGMAVPTFVVDGIDGKGKVPLSPKYLMSSSKNSIKLRNYKFETFDYQNPS